MYVKLLDYTKRPPGVLATIRVDHGQLIIEGTVPPAIKSQIEMVKARSSGESLFLRSLLTEFSGSYLRAKFIP